MNSRGKVASVAGAGTGIGKPLEATVRETKTKEVGSKKRDAVLHTNLAQEFGYVGFHGAFSDT